MSAMKSGTLDRSYRPDIDGIRAIAILSVVLYHAGVPFLTGGFTGVDIFFVISGYLIGGHIFSEVRTGSFSYLRFYQRRAKRILPAFYAVLVFTILVALLMLSPAEAGLFGRHGFAATLSAENVELWRTSDLYFQADRALNPLLMAWSLGVEEQFYAVIPFLMVLLARIRRRLLLPAILTICTLSFLFAWRRLGTHPAFVFYMLPARAWELGVGVALAVAELSRKRHAAFHLTGEDLSAETPAPSALLTQLMGLTGLASMLAPMALLNTTTPFPGAAALPSVLGAALVIAVPASWINRRLLSLPPLVFIGRISYSWYLWHWPLLIFVRIAFGVNLPPAAVALTIAASLAAAVLSYYFIEQPLRRSSKEPAPLLVRYAIASAVLLAACAGLWLSHGVPQRFPSLARIEAQVDNPPLYSDPCLIHIGKDEPNRSPACSRIPAARRSIALWGDSHAAALAPGLRASASAQGFGFVQLNKAVCPPLIGASIYNPQFPLEEGECFRFNRKALNLLKADHSIQIVILACYWELPFQQGESRWWLTSESAHNREIPTLDASRQLFKQSLTASIQNLRDAGKQVIVIEDIPGFDSSPVSRILAARIPARHNLALWLGAQDANDSGFAPPSDIPLVALVDSLLQEATAGLPGVSLVDLKPALCRTPSQCAYRIGDRLLYLDPHHLSSDGARYAVRDLRLSTLPFMTQ